MTRTLQLEPLGFYPLYHVFTTKILTYSGGMMVYGGLSLENDIFSPVNTKKILYLLYTYRKAAIPDFLRAVRITRAMNSFFNEER